MILGRKHSQIRRFLTIFLGSVGHAVAILFLIGYCLVFSYLSIAQRESRDIHYIPFEAGHWGEIIIEVGLYDLETGRRLEVEDGQDKVILGWLPE